MMRGIRAWLLALLCCGPLGTATAQVPQVVQLPSFRTLSYSGTVVVPDRGTTSLGGSASAYRSSQRRGLSRGIASGWGAAGLSTSATIIDLQQLDRQVLAAAGADESGRSRGGSSAAVLDPTTEGKSLVRYARRCYSEGRRSLAFEAYRLALSKLDGELHAYAAAEFRRLFGTAAEQVIRVAAKSE